MSSVDVTGRPRWLGEITIRCDLRSPNRRRWRKKAEIRSVGDMQLDAAAQILLPAAVGRHRPTDSGKARKRSPPRLNRHIRLHQIAAPRARPVRAGNGQCSCDPTTARSRCRSNRSGWPRRREPLTQARSGGRHPRGGAAKRATANARTFCCRGAFRLTWSRSRKRQPVAVSPQRIVEITINTAKPSAGCGGVPRWYRQSAT